MQHSIAQKLKASCMPEEEIAMHTGLSIEEIKTLS